MIKFNDKKKESDRIKAYKLLNKLKDKGISRPEIIKILIDNYGVNKGRVYDWYSGRNMPWKLKEKVEHLEYCEELFYLLGAMLGDGCIYEWKGQFQVKIYGEKEFIEKCAIKLSLCLKKDIKCYYYKSYFKTRGSHLWYIQTSHKKLFMLFQSIRTDLGMVLNLMKNKSFKGNSINFIEGFFDAEGCV
ncbi:hypothetical protein CMI42_02750, partial [Candidatus Pacearchaeota archaeon]|nr:hypothetical protein [Candidatus Pacearchaeota archaeon]